MRRSENLRPRAAGRVVAAAVLSFLLPFFCGGCLSNRGSTMGTASGFESETSAGPVTIKAQILGYSKPDPSVQRFLRDALRKVESGSTIAQVRTCGDIGVAAMYFNCLDVAEEALSRAIGLCERIDKGVFKGPESAKFFKGEPHERALLYFHMGVCDFARGDYENARACFRQGALQDAMAKENIDRGDWLAMDLFQLRSDFLARGCILDEDLKRQMRLRYVQKADSSNTAGESSSQMELNRLVSEQEGNARSLIEMPVDSDVIVVIALGQPPRKIAYGKNGAQLGYVEARSRVHRVKVHLPERVPQRVPVADDSYVQAVTRGQRQMDEVLQYRAKTKTLIVESGRAFQAAGAAVGGVYGLPLQILAEVLVERGSKKDVSADTRQLRLAPGKILLWCGRKKEVGQSLKITFEDEKGNTLAATDTLTVPQKGRSVIMVRYGG
jgi:hypothetical protein